MPVRLSIATAPAVVLARIATTVRFFHGCVVLSTCRLTCSAVGALVLSRRPLLSLAVLLLAGTVPFGTVFLLPGLLTFRGVTLFTRPTATTKPPRISPITPLPFAKLTTRSTVRVRGVVTGPNRFTLKNRTVSLPIVTCAQVPLCRIRMLMLNRGIWRVTLLHLLTRARTRKWSPSHVIHLTTLLLFITWNRCLTSQNRCTSLIITRHSPVTVWQSVWPSLPSAPFVLLPRVVTVMLSAMLSGILLPVILAPFAMSPSLLTPVRHMSSAVLLTRGMLIPCMALLFRPLPMRMTGPD